MSSQDQGSADCPPASLEGVQVVYRDDDGKLHCEWLNLKKINGITWCPDGPPKRPNKPPKKPMPTVPNGPDLSDCRATERKKSDDDSDSDAPICWWTGTEWECGQEA